jgi:mutual gliding-motility protein MglA
MVLFNYSTRELTAKIVYYGPGLCGKTTNLQYIYNSLPENVRKGKMLSLATKTDRTLFFDFLPIELGTIRGMRTRVQLYTVPGQVFYNSTRKLVLKGADGVVFVADSQSKMIDANVESYKNLEENLREMGIRLEEIPLVMQFNKRDLPNLASVEEMNTRINRHNAPFYEAVAMTGIGVEDTLKAITKLVLNNLSAKYRIEEGAAARPGAEPPAAPARPSSPAPRPFAPSPSVPPEDLALEALVPSGASPVAARPSRPATTLDLMEEEDDVIELVDEISNESGQAPAPSLHPAPPAAPSRAPAATIALHPAARPAASRPAPPPAARPAAAPAVALHGIPLNDEEPIEIDDPLDIPEEIPPVQVPVAAVSLGREVEREVEVPVRVDLGGRTLHIQLKLKVRLSG